MPSVRWALRRRANRAIDELNTRLKLRIQPFKLTKRQVLIDRLIYDPEVLHAADEYAREPACRASRDGEGEALRRRDRASFSAYAYFRVGTRIARRISQMLYRVRIGYRNDERWQRSTRVLGHLRHQSPLQHGLRAGDLCRSDLVGVELRGRRMGAGLGAARADQSMGAYFIRRDSREALYRKVLARYVHMATSAGVVQAIFPEGGLSRDGGLRPPKFGLLG